MSSSNTSNNGTENIPSYTTTALYNSNNTNIYTHPMDNHLPTAVGVGVAAESVEVLEPPAPVPAVLPTELHYCSTDAEYIPEMPSVCGPLHTVHAIMCIYIFTHIFIEFGSLGAEYCGEGGTGVLHTNKIL